jgi:hypothetical protein
MMRLFSMGFGVPLARVVLYAHPFERAHLAGPGVRNRITVLFCGRLRVAFRRLFDRMQHRLSFVAVGKVRSGAVCLGGPVLVLAAQSLDNAAHGLDGGHRSHPPKQPRDSEPHLLGPFQPPLCLGQLGIQGLLQVTDGGA